MKKVFKCIALCFCALCFCLTCFNNVSVYAEDFGGSWSGANSGASHGSGQGDYGAEAASIRWGWFTNADKDYMRNWGWTDEDHPDVIAAFLTDGYVMDDGCLAHTTWSNIFRDWGFGASAKQFTGRSKLTDEDILDAIFNKLHNVYGEVRATAHGYTAIFDWYYDPAKRQESDDPSYILDMVWVKKHHAPPEVPPVPEPKKDTKLVITYLHGGLGRQIDDRDKKADWLWENGEPGPVEYWDRTNPNETVANRRIDAEITTVYRYPVCVKKSCTGSGKNRKCHCVKWEWKYKIIDRQPYTKDFTYNTITPTIKKEPFKPWNLNRNGYATIDDISSQYAHAKLPIELDVNNNQGIYDNSPLKALDINNDTFFKFKFTNGYLGMPSVFNWTNPPGTPPGILSNGTWEDAGSGGYANDRNAKADKDGLYRYNVKLHMSMSPNTKKPFVDTSSINFNGSEFTTSEEALQRPPWAGGELSTRFTYADTYWTDNNKEGSKFPAWWVNTYTMGRFYEYGSEWHGLVTISGIQDPNNVMYGTGQSTGYDSYKITIDANKQQKGLYVGYASASFEQPIITGTWEVKTVAGYVN